MKSNVYSITGEKMKAIDLPSVFSYEYRPDLIKRAVLASITHRIQPWGVSPIAGRMTSAHPRRKNLGISRVPRMKSGPRRAAFAPHVVGGFVAHPPKPWKVISEKINNKERTVAIKSAISITANKEMVMSRGHKFSDKIEFPIIVENKIQTVKKTKDTREIFKSLGVWDDIIRSKSKTIRAGRGKMRGRKYKNKIGPLIVIGKDAGIMKAARNHPGVDIVMVDKLSAEHLAPGTHAGRLTIWTEDAIKYLSKSEVFK